MLLGYSSIKHCARMPTSSRCPTLLASDTTAAVYALWMCLLTSSPPHLTHTAVMSAGSPSQDSSRSVAAEPLLDSYQSEEYEKQNPKSSASPPLLRRR